MIQRLVFFLLLLHLYSAQQGISRQCVIGKFLCDDTCMTSCDNCSDRPAGDNVRAICVPASKELELPDGVTQIKSLTFPFSFKFKLTLNPSTFTDSEKVATITTNDKTVLQVKENDQKLHVVVETLHIGCETNTLAADEELVVSVAVQRNTLGVYINGDLNCHAEPDGIPKIPSSFSTEGGNTPQLKINGNNKRVTVSYFAQYPALLHPRSCRAPTIELVNGKWSRECSGTYFSATCGIECPEKFTPAGSAQCVGQYWATTAYCKPIGCPLPPTTTPQNGVWGNCTNTPHGSSCPLLCKKLAHPSGNGHAVCELGNWLHDSIDCYRGCEATNHRVTGSTQFVPNKIYGCSGHWEKAGLSQASGLCGIGFHVCASDAEASHNGLTHALCRHTPGTHDFFAAGQGGWWMPHHGGWGCAPANSSKDDIFGCGGGWYSQRGPVSDRQCVTFNAFLSASYNAEEQHHGWFTPPASTLTELSRVSHFGKVGGGVLCCRAYLEQAVIVVDQDCVNSGKMIRDCTIKGRRDYSKYFGPLIAIIGVMAVIVICFLVGIYVYVRSNPYTASAGMVYAASMVIFSPTKRRTFRAKSMTGRSMRKATGRMPTPNEVEVVIERTLTGIPGFRVDTVTNDESPTGTVPKARTPRGMRSPGSIVGRRGGGGLTVTIPGEEDNAPLSPTPSEGGDHTPTHHKVQIIAKSAEKKLTEQLGHLTAGDFDAITFGADVHSDME